jgi:hypothetical protein
VPAPESRVQSVGAPLSAPEVVPMFVLGVPLLIFPFAIYNILVFLMPTFAWTGELWHFRMMSGGEWGITPDDIMIAGSIVILLIEMLKAARMSRRTIVDHLLSMILFVGMLVEFLMVKQVASTTFFLLLVISFVDVAGGFAVGRRAAQRDISFQGVENAHSR